MHLIFIDCHLPWQQLRLPLLCLKDNQVSSLLSHWLYQPLAVWRPAHWLIGLVVYERLWSRLELTPSSPSSQGLPRTMVCSSSSAPFRVWVLEENGRQAQFLLLRLLILCREDACLGWFRAPGQLGGG